MTSIEQSTRVSRGIGAVLSDSLDLYRAHAKVFLTAAAIALVPIYLVHALLTAAFLPSAPSSRLEERNQRIERQSKLLERHAQAGTLDSASAQRLQQEMASDVSANLADAGGAVAGAGLLLLSMLLLIPLSMLGTFFGTAAVIPLVDDRARGGTMTPAAAWAQVGGHVGPLLVTSILATIAVVIGLFFFVVPGLVLAFLFAFAAPIVMLEDKAGLGALKRSAKLVLANLIPTAVVLVVLAVLTAIARGIGALITPSSWVFIHTLVPDLISLIVFPLPIIGLVLLYREVREPAAVPQVGSHLAAQ